jgi:hypothetical protein
VSGSNEPSVAESESSGATARIEKIVVMASRWEVRRDVRGSGAGQSRARAVRFTKIALVARRTRRGSTQHARRGRITPAATRRTDSRQMAEIGTRNRARARSEVMRRFEARAVPSNSLMTAVSAALRSDYSGASCRVDPPRASEPEVTRRSRGRRARACVRTRRRRFTFPLRARFGTLRMRSIERDRPSV